MAHKTQLEPESGPKKCLSIAGLKRLFVTNNQHELFFYVNSLVRRLLASQLNTNVLISLFQYAYALHRYLIYLVIYKIFLINFVKFKCLLKSFNFLCTSLILWDFNVFFKPSKWHFASEFVLGKQNTHSVQSFLCICRSLCSKSSLRFKYSSLIC